MPSASLPERARCAEHTVPTSEAAYDRCQCHHITNHTATGHHITNHTATGHHITNHTAIGHHITNHTATGHHITNHTVTGHHITNHTTTGHHITNHTATDIVVRRVRKIKQREYLASPRLSVRMAQLTSH